MQAEGVFCIKNVSEVISFSANMEGCCASGSFGTSVWEDDHIFCFFPRLSLLRRVKDGVEAGGVSAGSNLTFASVFKLKLRNSDLFFPLPLSLSHVPSANSTVSERHC